VSGTDGEAHGLDRLVGGDRSTDTDQQPRHRRSPAPVTA
jgi:hypothetical protein